MKWTGPAGNWIQVTDHHIQDDVSVLDRTSKLDLTGAVTEVTSFRPGIVGDPAFRACEGRTWKIPAVTALFQSGTLKVTQQTPAGSLRIVSIRERSNSGRLLESHTSHIVRGRVLEVDGSRRHRETHRGVAVTITETLTAINSPSGAA
jgi:hypothetical protein